MPEDRRSARRSVGFFVAGMLVAGALAIAPAGAHVTDSLGHLLKHFEARNTTQEFGQVRMDVNDPGRRLARVKPFTLTALCEQPDGPGTAIRAQVIITTSQANATLDAYDDEEVFSPDDNDNPEVWAQAFGGIPGGEPYVGGGGGSYVGRAMAPNGTSIMGDTTFATNFAGHDCVFSGYVTQTSR